MKQNAHYDTDFYAWTQEQAALLREGAVAELDLGNLAEEIASLGKSDRRALRSHLVGLVMHLLKWSYQPSMRQTGHSWADSIDEHRMQIDYIIRDSPSLRRLVPTLLAEEWFLATLRAAAGTVPLKVQKDASHGAEQTSETGITRYN